MAKAGRPKKVFTKEQEQRIDELAFEGHKTGTIATLMEVDNQTLERNYGQRMTKKRIEGRRELKKAQREKAIVQKDSTMLIWLGKNELEQTDKQNLDISGDLSINVVKYGEKDE